MRYVDDVAFVGSGLKMKSHTSLACNGFRSTLFDLRIEWCMHTYRNTLVVSPYYRKALDPGVYMRPVPDRNWSEAHFYEWARLRGKSWATTLLRSFLDEYGRLLDGNGTVVLFTCATITQLLMPILSDYGVSYTRPLFGLKGGEQCQWLLKQLEGTQQPRR